ncbi:unnamed protein product [Absidia cylindrospora]
MSIFRKSMNPNASEHNHEMIDPSEMVKAWPPEVNDMIIYLAQQRLQTHEIRDAVKQRFPMISWNERRFYNRLTEERKRIRQRNTTERARRLICLSTQLCAVVAANEEWSHCVESDLQRMFENFCHLTRLTPESIPSLVDLQLDAITQSKPDQLHRLSIDTLPEDNDDDIDDHQFQQVGSPVKKRKASNGSKQQQYHQQTPSPSTQQTQPQQQQQRGVQCVSIPAFNVYVRSQSLRSSSESSQGSRRTCDSITGLDSPINSGSSFVGGNNGLFSLSSPTSSSSSSSSSIPFRQQSLRLDVQQQQQRLTSPPLQHSPHDPSSFIMSQQQQHQQPYAMTNLTYDMQTSFSPYSIPTPSFSSSSDLPYTLDSTQPTSAPQQLPQHLVMTSRANQQQQQQQHDHSQQERPSVLFNNFCPSVKTERNMFDRSMSSTTGYNNAPLPMIRSNDHSNGVPTAPSESNVTAAYY